VSIAGSPASYWGDGSILSNPTALFDQKLCLQMSPQRARFRLLPDDVWTNSVRYTGYWKAASTLVELKRIEIIATIY
jgi:hypothetical protein